MGRPEEMTIEELEKWIEARKDWLKRVIDFVEDIAVARGRVIKKDESSDHTYVARELNNFAGFVFCYSTGHTMMGGNKIVVRYRQEKVLELWYQLSDETPNVYIWENDMEWQLQLTSVMQRKGEIIKAMDEAVKVQKESAAKKAEEDKRREELLGKAKRLKLE